ncbi:MAG TPA: NAD-dependent epimerase [Opitutaceae bacterium]|jgi:UDP-glucuronate 4-epimerase|nr:NAD-dependent epimerase [Opitutaceae bacterium]
MILVTGSAGFIGFHVSRRLLSEGQVVHGVDSLNAYYDVGLKKARSEILQGQPNFTFHAIDLADPLALKAAFATAKPTQVIHLAAQAGVRHSMTNPRAYADSNILGFLNVLELCREHSVAHLVYASSSSVYGLNGDLPFSTHASTEHPVSFYAATKKANELMAHSYSHLFNLPTTGLRLFTVYGPWGRPDMALFSFTKAILEGTPIEIFGDGRMRRDYTYVDDVVEGIVRLSKKPATANAGWNPARPDPASSSAPYRVYNIGNRSTIEVLRLIEVLEDSLGVKAVKHFVAAQACEVQAAIADSDDLETETGFRPATPLETGVRKFVEWYRDYYRA